MPTRRVLIATTGLLLGLAAAMGDGPATEKHPVFVGVAACTECHEGRAAGSQFSLWRASKHASAYAALWSPQAKQIARLSGLTQEPEQSPICLGCHATAAHAEAWERDEGFLLLDGVQCEKCHGPGSEYMRPDVMADREQAMQLGLKMPGRQDCMMCHIIKGSHVAVLGSPEFDVEAGWRAIAHPAPKACGNGRTPAPGAAHETADERPAGDASEQTGKDAETAVSARASRGAAVPSQSFEYIGAATCERCHHGPRMGYQYSRWRLSGHARAYAVLASPAARKIAGKSGSDQDPQARPDCLRCHAPQALDRGQAASPAVRATILHDGVHCESCHGPGSGYSPEAVMRDRKAAVQAGLRIVTAETCRSCHAGAHGRSFDCDAALRKIAHPTRPPTAARPSAKPFNPKSPTAKSSTAAQDRAAPQNAESRSSASRDTAIEGETTQQDATGTNAPQTADPSYDESFDEQPRYKTPVNLAISPDGREVYVACEASDSVIVVDAASRRPVAEIPVGGQPSDVAVSPDGSRLYVTNRLNDNLTVVETRTRAAVRTVAVGDEPHGVLTDASGRTVYALNTSSDSITVLDADALREVKRLSASRGPWSLALSPDGQIIAATNTLSRFVKFREPSVSEVTLIDTQQAAVVRRVEVPGANLMQGIAWRPSGEFALITLNRTKNLVPMTRLVQGWTITNGLGIVWRDGRVDQVLLDEPNLCFPDAADVAITPDGAYALVTSSGSNRVAVVDLSRLTQIVQQAGAYEREHVLPNHLGIPTEFVVKHIPTRDSPRGVAIAADGRTAYVANALDDSLTVIDLAKLEAVDRIDLGGPTEITQVRYGERLFHSADITFRRQFSCHSCHPDGHIDGLTYDIEPDGIGVSPVDNRTLRGILDTAPFKWEGTNPSLSRQCGPRLAVFFTRIQPFTPEELAAVDRYICTIPRPPNRYRPLGSELSPAQRRGKAIFERTMTNDGRHIPLTNQCAACHCPPYFTDRSQRDVGTAMPLDREAVFDVPHLNNIYDSAPYLHNGMAETLEEIWTRYNPYDQHGITNDMTKDQLNDLMEYLKTL